MHSAIPISVIVVTKNEEASITRCLQALQDFAEIVVVDSHSSDRTCDLARLCGARVIDFQWNGTYPKKRQWCLDHLDLASDWVFFVDADEVVTPELVAALRDVDFLGESASQIAGYFVKGRYVVGGRALKHGLVNNKLCLLDRRMVEFPVVDDLQIEGMGEIEGHYQPRLKGCVEDACFGAIKEPLLHYAAEDIKAWDARHVRYAQWERGMNARDAWPQDPIVWREALKRGFRRMGWLRPFVAFAHSYVVKLGFLEGRAGLSLARSRARYYRMIAGR